MSDQIEAELIRLQKKYLRQAITNCLPCYELGYKQPCMRQCSSQYIKFMDIREFYVQKNKAQLKKADLLKIEAAIDAL